MSKKEIAKRKEKNDGDLWIYNEDINNAIK